MVTAVLGARRRHGHHPAGRTRRREGVRHRPAHRPHARRDGRGGFRATATDVVVVNNWLTDLYFNSKKIPQSGHAGLKIGIIGSLLGPRENWPKKVTDGAERMHFDASIWDVFDVRQAQREFERLQRATTQAIRSVKADGGPRRDARLLAVIGIVLHSLQDFYAHSNWVEQPRVNGADGPDWPGLKFGHTPTFFDVPEADRNRLNVYIGDSTFHDDRTHGGWNTKLNKTMEAGVNKDWPGRLGYTSAYIAAYFATRPVAARAAAGHRRRALVASPAALLRPAPGRARLRPQGRPQDRDDDRPLAGPGRAVRPEDHVQRLRRPQRARRRPDRRAQRVCVTTSTRHRQPATTASARPSDPNR